MEKEFIPENLVEKLKEIGYNGPIIISYILFGEYKPKVDVIQRITFSQSFRWFREKHNIDGLLHKTAEGSYYFWITECEYENYNHYKYHNQIVYFKTYEEAELACLQKLIEIVESKSK